MTELIWNPSFSKINDASNQFDGLYVLISPFIKYDALKSLIDSTNKTDNLKVITRWRVEELWKGVSDLNIYTLLRERNIPLYINERLHAKLFVFGYNRAICTSSNVTSAALGEHNGRNFEIGCETTMSISDWQELYALLDKSLRVTDNIYNEYKKILDSLPSPVAPENFPKPNIQPEKLTFSYRDFPATRSPEKLYQILQKKEGATGDERNRMAHDLAVFGIDPNLPETHFIEACKLAFKSTDFAMILYRFIEKEKSVRFGQIRKWITQNCSDKPTPHTWEISNQVNILYDWLQVCSPSVYWDVPGAHSMVIYWKD